MNTTLNYQPVADDAPPPRVEWPDTPPDPPIVYEWSEFGHLLIHIQPGAEAAQAMAQALVAADEARLTAAAHATRNMPEAKEVVRLTALIADTNTQLAAAKHQADTYQAAAKERLGLGEDPATLEAAVTSAQHDTTVFDARAKHLTGLLDAAKKTAARAARKSLESVHATIVEKNAQRRAAIVAKLEATLPALATELTAIDQCDSYLFDPFTGAVPEQYVRLLESTT